MGQEVLVVQEVQGDHGGLADVHYSMKEAVNTVSVI